ncbi:hypothetical protein CU044_2842 [Streptomyces sp. L-9-10]|nr:hypothetical protein CU044_2842 [Streptomyces sp. L-9-10]
MGAGCHADTVRRCRQQKKHPSDQRVDSTGPESSIATYPSGRWPGCC